MAKVYTTWSVCRMAGGWRARFYYKDDETGKASRTTRTYRGLTRREAEARASEEFARLSGSPAGKGGDDPPLGSYMDNYIYMLEMGRTIAATTADSYRYCMQRVLRHIDPMKPVSQIEPADVARMQSGLMDEGLTAGTVVKTRRFLKQVLAFAIEDGVAERLPFNRHVKAPTVKRSEPNALDDLERARLLTCIDGVETPVAVAIRLALGAGLRREEVCGLRWCDVDFLGGQLKIRHVVTSYHGTVLEKEPKTSYSFRDVPVDDDLLSRLSERFERVFAPVVPGRSPKACRLYVIGRVDGTYVRPDTITREFKALASTLKLVGNTGETVTFHDLRHTYASYLVARNVDVKTVSSLMGHANPDFTLRVYASADPEARRRAVDVVRAAMSERVGGVAGTLPQTGCRTDQSYE